MEQTECSETSAFKLQTPGNYPKESIKIACPLHRCTYPYMEIRFHAKLAILLVKTLLSLKVFCFAINHFELNTKLSYSDCCKFGFVFDQN